MAAASNAISGPDAIPHATPDANGKMPMELLVVDAERRFDVAGKVQNLSFWVFKVLCRARIPEYLSPPLFHTLDAAPGQTAPKHFIVSDDGKYVDYCSYHRYSDFEWLRDRIKADFPGLLVPPIPSKDSSGTFDKLEDLVSGKDHERVAENPFMAARMRQLNLFVQALMPLKQLHNNQHIMGFIAMTETQWIDHRERTNKSLEKPVTAKSVFGGMKRFFGKIGKPKLPTFDATHPVGRIQARLRETSDSMLICAKHLETAAKHAHAAWEPKIDDNNFAAMAKHQLPPHLLFLSHRVCNREHLDGSIVHLDDASGRAFVDWKNGKDPEPVPQNSLLVPNTGIVDPVCLLAMQMVNGIDSTIIQMRTREEAAVLRDAVDYLYFLSNWARAGTTQVDEIAKISEEHRDLLDEKAGAKPADVIALEQQCQEKEKLFNESRDTFVASYHSFYLPQYRIGVHRVCDMAGKSCSNMLRSDDWTETFQAPLHLYECRFDEIHPSVAPLLRQQQPQDNNINNNINTNYQPQPQQAYASSPQQQQPSVLSNESVTSHEGVYAPP